MEIVYFELNNWWPGRDYPDEEPFLSWFEDDCKLQFEDTSWLMANQLCVVANLIDMSVNFCITAPKKWVEGNCPKLLTVHQKYLRHPNEDGEVYGKWGTKFLPWSKDNFGITWHEEVL